MASDVKMGGWYEYYFSHGPHIANVDPLKKCQLIWDFDELFRTVLDYSACIRNFEDSVFIKT